MISRGLKLIHDGSLNVIDLYSTDWQDFLAASFNLGHRYALTTPRCVIIGTAMRLSSLMARTDAVQAEIFIEGFASDYWTPINRDRYEQIVSEEYGDDGPIDGEVRAQLLAMAPYTEQPDGGAL